MTRAPRSASWRLANGAATACSTAMTSTPSSGKLETSTSIEMRRAARGSCEPCGRWRRRSCGRHASLRPGRRAPRCRRPRPGRRPSPLSASDGEKTALTVASCAGMNALLAVEAQRQCDPTGALKTGGILVARHRARPCSEARWRARQRRWCASRRASGVRDRSRRARRARRWPPMASASTQHNRRRRR